LRVWRVLKESSRLSDTLNSLEILCIILTISLACDKGKARLSRE
jgi:hypothetical protein